MNIKELFNQGFRFSIAGVVNTLLSLLIYQVCLLLMSHELSYGIAWIGGLVFLMVVYPSKVFAVHNSSWSQRILIAALYVTSFLIGFALLNRLVAQVLTPQVAIFFVLAVTTTINFVGMRYILRANK